MGSVNEDPAARMDGRAKGQIQCERAQSKRDREDNRLTCSFD
jgi:hypothetical protein